MGDVVSRGVRAASTMGQLRNALRAYAVSAAHPGAVLDHLHRLAHALGEPVFATVTYLVVEPASGECVLASAGHLPPLMVTGGRAELVEIAQCAPVGVRRPAACRERAFTLGPGSTLVLYTDGLVETRTRSIDDGLERLARAAAGARDGVDAMADALLTSGITDGQDDVALLVLRRRDG
jgi:serine/threonine-protein kinase RsbW